jgi:hypothetical protein
VIILGTTPVTPALSTEPEDTFTPEEPRPANKVFEAFLGGSDDGE